MASRRSPRHGFLCSSLLGLTLGLLGACGTPSQSLTMGLGAAEALQLSTWVPEGLKQNVALDRVKGGDETSRWWGSRVSGLALEQALEDSLRGVGMWPLAPLPSPRYQLQAQMLSLVQPLVAADMSVTAVINYSLVDTASSAVLYQRTVRTAHTTAFSEALLSQPERTRLANEAAVRANIALALRDLLSVKLPP